MLIFHIQHRVCNDHLGTTCPSSKRSRIDGNLGVRRYKHKYYRIEEGLGGRFADARKSQSSCELLLRRLSALDVAGQIDLVGQLRDVHLEALLHLVEGLGVRLVRHEGDGQALGAEPGQKA